MESVPITEANPPTTQPTIFRLGCNAVIAIPCVVCINDANTTTQTKHRYMVPANRKDEILECDFDELVRCSIHSAGIATSDTATNSFYLCRRGMPFAATPHKLQRAGHLDIADKPDSPDPLHSDHQHPIKVEREREHQGLLLLVIGIANNWSLMASKR